jgi:hypothetical protein
MSLLSRKCGSLDVSTTLWAFTACYRDSFTFTFTIVYLRIEIQSVDIPNTLEVSDHD